MATRKPTNTTREDAGPSRAQRSMPMERANFRSRHDLSFPAAVEHHYSSLGYGLRWVSVIDFKTRTFNNQRINHFLSIGGGIVTPSEIKALDPGFLSGLTKYEYREDFASDDEAARGSQTGIRKDDLILMKIPLEYRQHMQDQARALSAEHLASAERSFKARGLNVEKNEHSTSREKISNSFFSG